jgi:hypothetical protein
LQVSFNETLGIEVVDEKGKTCGSTLTYAYFVSFIFFCSFLVKILLKSNLRSNLVRSHLESKKTTSEAPMGVIIKRPCHKNNCEMSGNTN